MEGEIPLILFNIKEWINIGRRVRCQVTGEYGTVSTFYKKNISGVNKYYRDRETYVNMVKEQETRDELLTYVAVNILDYKGEQFLPPLFLRRIKELNKVYPYEVILGTFKDNEDTLLYWVNQSGKFKDENNRLNYMMAIIQNKINDTYLKWQIHKKREKEDNTVSVDMDILDADISSNRKNKTDISNFL